MREPPTLAPTTRSSRFMPDLFMRLDRVTGAGLLTTVVWALAAHISLSALGFNLLDEGFILAQSRRILAGEIPHLDFITIRPAGSAYLHTFEVWAGGDHLFMLSRFVFWLQLSLTGWCWVELLRRAGVRLSVPIASLLIGLSLVVSSHQFPAMAWHTVDGLCLASLGLLLLGSRSARARLLGALLLGIAIVCKQTFAPFALLALILAPQSSARGRERMILFATLLIPAALYVGVVISHGGAAALRAQVPSADDPFQMGLLAFASQPWHWLGVCVGAWNGAALGWALRIEPSSPRVASALRAMAVATTLAALGWTAAHLSVAGETYIRESVFVLTGVVAGLIPAALLAPRGRRLAGLTLLVLVLSWCVTLSYGYPSPALAGGPLLLVLLAVHVALRETGHRRSDAGERAPGRTWAVYTTAALVLFLPPWWTARQEQIYQDGPESALISRLDGIVPGAAGIRTNPVNALILRDLRDLIAAGGDRPYAVLVDGAAWWAGSGAANPLPCDWPQSIELRDARLRARFLNALERNRGHLRVIVQRVQLYRPYPRTKPARMDDPYFGAAREARALYLQTASTRYWDVLE